MKARDRRLELRWNRKLLVGTVVALGCLGVVPAAAQAVPNFSVTPEFPATVKAGENHPASVLITATGDNLTQGGNPVKPLVIGTSNYIAICNSPTDQVAGTPPGQCANSQIGPPYNQGLLVTPSCASPPVTTPICAAPDPGVFAPSPTASGSGSCAGTTFDITLFDAATGTLKFTPNPPGSRIWLGQAGSFCRISFSVNVLKAPAANPSTAIASAGGGYNSSESADDPNHVKPAPLRAFGVDQITTPPPDRLCPVPPYPEPLVLPPNIDTPQEIDDYCSPPDPSDAMEAAMTGTPRCPGASPARRWALRPFNVRVLVTQAAGSADANFLNNVVRVQFRRNGRLVKTVTKPSTGAIPAFVYRVDPRRLAPRTRYVAGPRGRKLPATSRLYTITSRVFLRAPGTFGPTGVLPLQLQTSPGPSIRFRAVRVCKGKPPRTTG